ncbi:MAG: hypothetical protein ABH830_04380 [Patescibacteria group bacterium]
MIDANKIDLKKEIEELQKNDPGKERGEDIKYLVNYVLRKKGSDGLKRVKAELEKLNYQMPDVAKIDDMDWIPTSLVNIFFLASIKQFNWQEKDIIEMGRNALSFKSLTKFFIKYFSTVEKTFRISAKDWRKHYDFGSFEVGESKKKSICLRVIDFNIHPLTCIYLLGLFGKVVEMASGSKEVIGKETKCMFRGNSFHEFKFTW